MIKSKKICIVWVCVLTIMAMMMGCGGGGGVKAPSATDPVPQPPAGMLEAELVKTPVPAAAPGEGIQVEITMQKGGVILLELDSAAAPIAVENFVKLARAGFYDGLLFHRIDPNFMIQGGCPEGTGTGGPGYTIKGEFSNNGWDNPISHTRGVISMARSRDYDSAGSQFFITVKDSTFLDGDYAAFGRVLEGMDVVDEIANAKRNGERPVEDIVIKSIRVIEG